MKMIKWYFRKPVWLHVIIIGIICLSLLAPIDADVRGSRVYSQASNLISNLFTQDSGVLVGTGSGTYQEETGATLRTSIGIGTGDSPQLTGINVGHASDTTITRNAAGDLNVEGKKIYRVDGNDVDVADGGTGVSTLTDGGVLLGSGGDDITAMSVLGDGEMIVGDGTTDPVAESGATLRTSIGVGTGDSPQLNGIELGHASDSTGARASAGDWSIEGNLIYRVDGNDVDVEDGGTGVSTLTDGGILLGSGANDITAMDVLGDGYIVIGDGTTDPTTLLIDPNWEPMIQGENTASEAQRRTWKSDVRLDHFIDVRDYGADPTGVADSTTAIQAALDAADTTTGIVFFPAGVYKITDGLTWPEGVSLVGVELAARPLSNHTGDWFDTKGACIYFTEDDDDNSSFLTAAWSTSHSGKTIRVENIQFMCHQDCDEGRNVLDLDIAALRDLSIKNCYFYAINGYALTVDASDNAYLGAHIIFHDNYIYNCAGGVRVYDSAQDYISWGVDIQNCSWDGGTWYDPCDYIFDLRSADPVSFRNVIIQGYGPDYAEFTDFTPIALSPMNQQTIDTVHFEWNEGMPSYDIYIGRQGESEEIEDGSGQIEIRNTKFEGTHSVHVDANNVKLVFDNCSNHSGHSIEDMYSEASGVTGTQVEFRTLQYDPTPGDLEQVLGMEQQFGKYIDPNHIGRVTGSITSSGNSYSNLHLPNNLVIFDWDASKGRLDTYRTPYVSAAADQYCSGPYYGSDPNVGRYNYYIGDDNKVPAILWSWDFPTAWGEKIPIILTIQFKPTLESGATTETESWVGYTTGKPATSNTSARYTEWIDNTTSEGNSQEPTQEWQVGYCAIYDADNTGTWGMRPIDHPDAGRFNIQISRVIMSIGSTFIYPTGIIDDAQVIAYPGSAAPSDANNTYLQGDIIYNNDPDADEVIGWVCSVAGTPGTWIPFGFIGDTDVTYQTKTVIKTISADDDDSSDDFQCDDDAENTNEQNIDLGTIIPAYAEIVSAQIRCFEALVSSGGDPDQLANLDLGISSGGAEILANGLADTLNEINTTVAADSPEVGATNAARHVYFNITPEDNWNTITAGRWAVMITYIDYGAAYTQKNP